MLDVTKNCVRVRVPWQNGNWVWFGPPRRRLMPGRAPEQSRSMVGSSEAVETVAHTLHHHCSHPVPVRLHSPSLCPIFHNHESHASPRPSIPSQFPPAIARAPPRDSLEVESEAGVVLLDENTRSTLHSLGPDATLLSECRKGERTARAFRRARRYAYHSSSGVVRVAREEDERGVGRGKGGHREASRVSFESGEHGGDREAHGQHGVRYRRRRARTILDDS